MIDARFLIFGEEFLVHLLHPSYNGDSSLFQVFFSSLNYPFAFAAFNWYLLGNVLVLIWFPVYIAFRAISGFNTWTQDC